MPKSIQGNRMSIQVCILYFLIWSACGVSDSRPKQHPPKIDFDGVAIENPETLGQLQIMLRMSLKNYDGDILKYGLNESQAHQERIQYYLSEFKKDLFLVTKADTISPLDVIFERPQMDLPYRNFILTFNHASLENQDRLRINDPVYSQKIIETTIRKNYE